MKNSQPYQLRRMSQQSFVQQCPGTQLPRMLSTMRPSETSISMNFRSSWVRKVTVTTMTGQEFVGVCKAVLYQHLNIVLMTPTEKILLKNISHMARERTSELRYR